MRDVIFHLADKNMESGFRAFFSRDNWHHVIGCRRFAIDPESDEDIFYSGGRTDGALWKQAHINLTLYKDEYAHAVVVVDSDFDPYPGAETIRKDIQANMEAAGWLPERFCVVVIDPELEAWLWVPNVNVAHAFGHSDFAEMKSALASENLWDEGRAKPNDLKRARDRATRLGGKKTGGPIFKGVFGGISKRACDLCEEQGFITMRRALQQWFPVGGEAE